MDEVIADVVCEDVPSTSLIGSIYTWRRNWTGHDDGEGIVLKPTPIPVLSSKGAIYFSADNRRALSCHQSLRVVSGVVLDTLPFATLYTGTLPQNSWFSFLIYVQNSVASIRVPSKK